MSRRSKKKREGEPKLPQWAEWTVVAAKLAAAFGWIYLRNLPLQVFASLEFRDSQVLAVSMRLSVCLFQIGLLALLFWAAFMLEYGMKQRIPAPEANPHRYDAYKQNAGKKMRLATIIVLPLSLLMCGFGFFGRDVLRQDLSVVHYSLVNTPTVQCEAEDLTAMEISVRMERVGSRGISSPHLYLTVEDQNGESYRFEKFCIKGEPLLQRLEGIRAEYPFCTVSGNENTAERFAGRNQYTEEEQDLLYRLLDLTDTARRTE